jgi:ribosomal RNA assembly protein
MVRKIVVENLKKIKKAVPRIEAKTKIRTSFSSGFVIIKGKELEEFLVEKVISAIDFGFEVEDALLLLNGDYSLEFIDIKDHTHRKNLHDVRSRVIGTNGKALNTVENLTGAILVVKDNKIGVISEGAVMNKVNQALESIIRGAKHGNVFSSLERRNRAKKKEIFFGEDLGLKEEIKKKYSED